MRTTTASLVMALALALALAAGCSEGVTPTCTGDAGCGTKPGAEASISTTP
jgi:hypothetical protein